MLYLTFQADENAFAMDTGRVALVAPCARLMPIPGAPQAIAGVMNFHGEPLAVLDLKMIIAGKACRRLMGTRIIVARHRLRNGSEKLLGLMAEWVTGLVRKEERDLMERAANSPGVECLDGIFREGGRLIQIVDPEKVVPAELEKTVFATD